MKIERCFISLICAVLIAVGFSSRAHCANKFERKESAATGKNAGTLIVYTPGVDYAPIPDDWNVGDTTKAIKWKADGNISKVWIDVWDGARWIAFTDSAGEGLDAGNGTVETITVGNWLKYARVPDIKSNVCKIRVKDHPTRPVVEDESEVFSIYPTITGVTVMPSAGDEGSDPVIWRAGLPDQTVTWTENYIFEDDLIGTVQIYFSPTGELGLPGILIKDGVRTHERCSTITAPTDLSWEEAAIRVRDKDAGFRDKIYGDSTEFRVLGRVIYGASPASGDNWRIGDTDKTVTWTAYGDEMTSVDIYIDYGSGFVYQKTEPVIPGSPNSWVYDDISAEVEGVGDYVTENAVIRIADSDANRSTETQYDSPTFKIAGKFENVQVEPVEQVENTEVVAGLAATITWTKTGAAITDAVIQYSKNAGTNWLNITNDVEDDLTTVTNTENYSWVPPANAITDACLVRIFDPDNTSAMGQTSSFIITSKCKVLQPDVNDSWGAGTQQTITWQKWGDFATVNIDYRPDDQTSWSLLTTSGAVESCQDEMDGLGDTLNGSWLWHIESNTVLSATAEIRVIDAVNSTATLAGISEQFTTKGSLLVQLPDGNSDYLAGNTAEVIRWERFGNISGVKIFLSTDGSSYPPAPITGFENVVFEGAETVHEENWTPPEIVGTTYRIKVQDVDNAQVEGESELFKVKGVLQITMPGAQQPTWAVSEARTITWDVQYGNMANVRIIGSRSGNFTGGADEFTVVSSTDADNVTAFDGGNTPVARGSYEWNISEYAPSIIGDAVKLRVMDANTTDFDVKTTSTLRFTITGHITVDSSAEGSEWRVTDTDKTVAWTCDGEVTDVNIQFSKNGAAGPWTTIASNVASTAGSGNTWSTANWVGGSGVQDAKSANCMIRVIDNELGVYGDSAAFKVYPTIIVGNVSDSGDNAPPLRAETTGNKVHWTTPGSATVTSVDIYIDFNDGAGGYLAQLQDNWGAGSPCDGISLPTTLSEAARLKVVDNTITEVYGVSSSFAVHGTITANTPIVDWTIGSEQSITWTHKGDISQVNIYVDYDDTGGYQQIAANADASGEAWTWPSVVDNATDAAKIKVEDADSNRSADTYGETGEFNIVGSFTILTPGTGETVTYGSPFDITWTPNGTSVTTVDITYDIDGSNSWQTITTVPVANTGNPASYSWTLLDMVSTANARIKIEASDPTDPATPAISGGTNQPGLFAIQGDITFGNSPVPGAPWEVGTTGNSIEWTLDGKVDNLDVIYSKDNGSDSFAYTIASDLDSTTYATGYSWNIPTNQDILSDGLGLIRVKDSNYSTVFDDSPNFSIRGILSGFDIGFPADAGTYPNVLRVAEDATITWSRTGRTMGNVCIRYSTDRGVTWPSGKVICTMASGNGATGYAWSVEDDIVYNNGIDAGVIVRIESVDDTDVYTESGILSIVGRIQIDDPEVQQPTYVVSSTSEVIKWTPTGTFTNVVIDFNTESDFSGAGGTVTPATSNSASGVQGSHIWSQVPDFIDGTLYMRVADAAYPALVKDVSASPFAIQGSITAVSKPVTDEVWYIGDTNRTVEWTCNGSISKVEIAFAKGTDDPATAFYTVISPAGGVDSGDGTYTWTTDNWDAASAFNGGVADAKSDKCYIKIKDINDTTVPAKYSSKFTIKPKVTVENVPTWTAGTKDEVEAHEVTWSMPGSTVAKVRIDLSYDGGNTWPVNLASGVPENKAMPYTLPKTLPDTLSRDAVLKVSDNDALYSGLVNKKTGSFKIIGGLTLLQPAAGVNWEAGTTEQITWVPYGNMGGNVYVYYRYDGGEYGPLPAVPTTASSGTCDWLVPDRVSGDVRVLIRDALRPNDTFDESSAFNITARFDITYPENGDVIMAEDPINIIWNKYGILSLTHVKLEYTANNGSDWHLITDGVDDGGGSDLLVANTGSCSWIPDAGLLSNECRIRVSEPDNPASANEGAGVFTIRAGITVTAPVYSGNDIIWDVGSSHDIAWSYKGDFPNVLIYYSTEGSLGPWTLIDERASIYPYGPGDGDNDDKKGLYSWTLPETTPLSTNAYIKVAKSDERDMVFGLSDRVTFKGNVIVERPKPSIIAADAIKHVYGGRSPQYCYIDWTVSGKIENIVIQYTTDDISWKTIDTVKTSERTDYNWAIPGTDPDIIGTGRKIKVYDADNQADTYDISEDFEIKGGILLEYPTLGGGEVFVVGAEENIQWKPYGNFPGNRVKISGSTDNFTSDIFTIAIRAAGMHGESQAYTWNVKDVTSGDLSLSANVKVRVEDADDATVVDTGGLMTINGALTINTPSEIWYVNDTDRSITWNYDGPIQRVDLYIRDAKDTAWIPIAAGVDCGLKDYSGFTVPDAISDTSRLKIKDPDDVTGTVEDISGDFIIRGKLAFRADKPALDQKFIVGKEKPGHDNTIFWDMDGTFTTVEIRYSTDDGSTFPADNIIARRHNAYNPYKWDPVEDDISSAVKFKVIDECDADNVYAISPRVQIKGSIDITGLKDYDDSVKVGDVLRISWHKKGRGMRSVDITYSTNGGDDGYPHTIVSHRDSTDSPYAWKVSATDPLSPSTVIKVADHDDPGETFAISPAFRLKADWEWNESSGNGDPAGKVWIVGDEEVFEWTTAGRVNNVRIDYDVEGDGIWEDPPIAASVANTGTYTWTVPDIAHIFSERVKIRISDVNDRDSELESGKFKIREYLNITSPVAGDEWDVGSGHPIQWEYRGPISEVDLYYAYDGEGYSGNKINSTPLAADSGSAGYLWEIPDRISGNITVKVVDALDAAVYGESGVLSIRGIIEMDRHPVSTDHWVLGDKETVSWTKTGTIPAVSIEHSPTGLPRDYTVVPGAENLEGTTFLWTIPDRIGVHNRVRIKNADPAKPSAAAVSDEFRIAPRLELTFPQAGEVVTANLATDGEPLKYKIEWFLDGTMSKVELLYSYDGGDFEVIQGANRLDAETSPGSGIGEFLWTVPSTIESANVVVKVRSKDAGQTDVEDDSEPFTIAGRFDLTSPDGGEIYDIDDIVPIQWVTRGAYVDYDAKLKYSTNGGSTYDFTITPAGGVPAGDQVYNWTIPDNISDAVKIKISDEDELAYTISDESRETFGIRPKIEILRPTSNDIWIVGDQEVVQWYTHGSVETVKIEFSVGGVLGAGPIIASVDCDTSDYAGTGEPDGYGQYLWTLPVDAVGKDNVRIKITGLGNKDVTSESDFFTVRGGFGFIDRSGENDDSPLSSARWAVNSNKTIKWTTSGKIDTVHVYYTDDGTDPATANWYELTDPVTGIANTGRYLWTGVTNTVDSDYARIKIADSLDADAVGYSEFFTIHDMIYLDRSNDTDDPRDAKTLLVGDTEDIKWHTEAKDTGGTGITAVKIEYSTDGGETWISPAITDSTDNDGLYVWQVPDAIGTRVKVKVSDADDSLVEDVLSNDCSIRPEITLTQPDPSSTWYSGNEETISWATSGNVPNVEIYYSTDNGGSWSRVRDEVIPIETWPYPNDGSFEWKIPDIVRTDQAIIKVVSATDRNASGETALFNIKGRLTINYPTDTGEVFRCGTSETLMWSTDSIIPTVGLKYWYSGSWHDILNRAGGIPHVNGGSFDWAVPDIRSGDAKIQIYDLGGPDVKGESRNVFDIKPRLVFEDVDEPVGGEIYLCGTPQTISWTTYGPVNNVDIEYSKEDMATWVSPAITASEPNSGSHSWTIPDSVSGDCYIRIKDSSDAAGTFAVSGKFRIRTMISLIRPDGGVQVGVSEKVEIKWEQIGDTDDIYLYYFDDLAGVPLPIDGSTGIMANPTEHSYWWTVPDFINGNVKIGVADPNDVAGTKDESAAVFPVTATFTVTSPDGGSKWNMGDTYPISWVWTGTVDNMNLYYSMNGVDYNPIILLTDLASDPDKMYTFDWYIDPVIITAPSPDFYIKIADSLDADNAYGVSDKAEIRADITLDHAPLSEDRL